MTTNLDLPKKGGRIQFGVDEAKLGEQFFGLSMFEFGDDPKGPVMTILVIPPDLDGAPHYHDTDYCTVVIKGSLRVGGTWYETGSLGASLSAKDKVDADQTDVDVADEVEFEN